MGLCQHAVSGRKLRIEFDCTIQKWQCFSKPLLRSSIDPCQTAQVVLVSIKAPRRLSPNALDLSLFKPGCERTYDARSELVLQGEEVLYPAIEPISPNLMTGGRFNQLASDPNSTSRFSKRALENIPNP